MKKYIVIGILLVGAIIAATASYVKGTGETVTVDIVKTERIAVEDGGKYLVYTDGETFENTDSIFIGKFNSSDIYGKLTPGTYKLEVYGWRMPMLSSYRNIVSAERLSD